MGVLVNTFLGEHWYATFLQRFYVDYYSSSVCKQTVCIVCFTLEHKPPLRWVFQADLQTTSIKLKQQKRPTAPGGAADLSEMNSNNLEVLLIILW